MQIIYYLCNLCECVPCRSLLLVELEKHGAWRCSYWPFFYVFLVSVYAFSRPVHERPVISTIFS